MSDSASKDYTVTGSGTNDQVRRFLFSLHTNFSRSFIYRGTIGAAVRAMTVVAGTTILTSTRPWLFWTNWLIATRRRDGGYYYQNTNGSKYYNDGKGFSKYTSPDGSTKVSRK